MNNDAASGVQRPGEVTQDYTQIPNKLLEAAYGLHCSGAELAIILVVLRYTYGFQRASHKLSLSFLAQATGRHYNRVSLDVRRLLARGVLYEQSSANYNRPRVLAINTRCEEWVSLISVTVTENDDTPITVNDDTDLTVHDDQEIKRKERSKRKHGHSNEHQKSCSEAEELYEYYADRVRAGARADAIRSIKKLLGVKADDGSDPYSREVLRSCIDCYAGNGMPTDKHYRIQCNNFFGRAERFKDYLNDKKPAYSTAFSPLQDDLQRQRDSRAKTGHTMEGIT